MFHNADFRLKIVELPFLLFNFQQSKYWIVNYKSKTIRRRKTSSTFFQYNKQQKTPSLPKL